MPNNLNAGKWKSKPVITLSAGPVGVYPRVLRAMATTVQYDYDEYFLNFYENVARKAALALKVDEPPLILSMEPAPGIEAAAASLISKDDVVLNLVSGVYGKGFGYWAVRYCKKLVEVEVAYNESLTAEMVADALKANPDVTIVSAVHHDTPSGTINPMREIGQVIKDHGALLLVDAVSSWSGMDMHPHDCQADVFITGPGKCLGGAPGLTLIHVSDAAWEHIDANENAPFASVLSLSDWRNAWKASEPFPFTPSVAEINGLDAALDNYLEEGPENVWARHDLTARACRAGMRAMGCEIWAATDEIASPTTTSVCVPNGIVDKELRQAARNLYGVAFSSGRNETMGKLVRIGHMGVVAQPIYATIAITALGGALNSLGFKADVGAGVKAAMAVIEAK